jgi:hypothetical protein
MTDEFDPINPDPGVRVIVRVLDALEKWVLYEWLCRWKPLRTEYLAYPYVIGWLVVLAATLLTSRWWSTAEVAVAIVVVLAAYRGFDITRWWIDFLLDRKHWAVVSAERNLVFVAVNLAEVAIIGAIWLRAADAASTAGTAMFQGFTLVTQLGYPQADTAWSKIAIAVTEFMALLLLFGGVTSLLAVVADKIRQSGTWQGSNRWAEDD